MSRTKDEDAIKSRIIARVTREPRGVEKSLAINKLGCFDSANKGIKKKKRETDK